jgi:hypothetical protein
MNAPKSVFCCDVTEPLPWQVVQVFSPLPPLPLHSSHSSYTSTFIFFLHPKAASSKVKSTLINLSAPRRALEPLLEPPPNPPKFENPPPNADPNKTYALRVRPAFDIYSVKGKQYQRLDGVTYEIDSFGYAGDDEGVKYAYKLRL